MEDLTFFAFGEDKKMQKFGDLSQLLTWEVKPEKTWPDAASVVTMGDAMTHNIYCAS